MTARQPQRTRKPVSGSPDVFKSAGSGGFTGSAKAGRTWGVSEHRPHPTPRPATRKDTTR
ncbi:hypothetical protein [Micromonospora sp. KLBMP9576]|uniref:hypothetical protein n=1 Tax=Micromonospora sp. KLBMP9576 TaxID=3424769 RepID=UPI003D8C34B5